MNQQNIIGALKTCDIQNNINGFVEDVIFEYEKDRDFMLKKSITFDDVYRGIILNRAHRTISRKPIGDAKSAVYNNEAFIEFYYEAYNRLFAYINIKNITSIIITSGITALDKMFNANFLSKGQQAGILQKYNNMVQKYLFCIGNYTGSVINISTQIKTDALALIKNKYLDCPIDNIILQNVIDSDFVNNFIHKPIKISKNYIKINGFTWSRLDKGLYDEIVVGIAKSCTDILGLVNQGLILTNSRNASYLRDKYINKGLLFDLLFWKRKISIPKLIKLPKNKS